MSVALSNRVGVAMVGCATTLRVKLVVAVAPFPSEMVTVIG